MGETLKEWSRKQLNFKLKATLDESERKLWHSLTKNYIIPKKLLTLEHWNFNIKIVCTC